MPANLEQNADGTITAFAENNERASAWHSLGSSIAGAMSADEALERAHLKGWNVRKSALTTNVIATDAKGKQSQIEIPVPTDFAVVRDNPFEPGTVDSFGTVGKVWQPIQNEETAALLDALHDESGSFFETAGSLNGGRHVFLTQRLPDTMLVGGVDPVDTYLAALNSHDGSKSFRFIVTPVRIVCSNTQAMAERQAGANFKIRHTKNAQQGIIAAAQDALGLTYKFIDEFETEAEKLIQSTLTNAKFEKIIEGLFPIADTASDTIRDRASANRAGVMSLFNGASTTMNGIEGTAWAGYQSVTEWLDHYIPFVGMAGPKAQERRSLLAVRGKSNALKAQAFKALVPAGK